MNLYYLKAKIQLGYQDLIIEMLQKGETRLEIDIEDLRMYGNEQDPVVDRKEPVMSDPASHIPAFEEVA